MAISSVGIGSGLDVEKIITETVALEKEPIKTLEVKAETINSKISTYGQIKSSVDTLNSAARDLTLDSGFDAVKINSSNSSAVNATMTGLAAQGSYNVTVDKLAQSQTSASIKLGAKDTMGAAGTMRFVIGNPGKAGAELKTVNLDIASSDTLEGIVAKINGNPDLSKSVVASVITDSTGKQQLMVRSRDTGLDNQFNMSIGTAADAATVTQADVDAWNALSDKDKKATPFPVIGSFKPVDVEDGSNLSKLAVVGGITVKQAAQNAEIKLNGVEMESNTNTFKDIIPGLSISVSAKGESLLSITQDKDATQEKIQKFVDAYNAVNELLAASTKYDQESKTAGVLQGDSSTVSLQNSLRMLTQGIAGNATGKFNRLSDIGIQMQQGGALTLDAAKLQEALGDMDSVKSMFAAKPDALGNGGGIAVNFKTLTDELLAYEGTLNNKTDSLEKQLELNKAEVEKVEKRAETVEERLRKQYTALDVKMASLSSLDSYISQMVTSWNKSKG
ncbi:flagellar filament capping protein FliD [Comamonas aquatica]|uniref:flagellar filament capping protein FliD n=1 Tax=Comamonas aquatica TaxID=225991 RepID=UPI002446BD4A|nr:flagellar filament capping protein FliD [Comamonas aquatica]MDH1815028.1 flagellar filament capping protein FliD [Comamonas aquatica]